MLLSYAAGPTDEPLLEETIGANLRAPPRGFGEREALVVRHQGYRATYAELWEQVDRAARAFIARGVAKGDRVGIWAPEPPRVGRHPVRDRADRRDPRRRSTPRTAAPELRHALRKAGVGVLVMARGFRGSRLRGDARRGPPRLPGPARDDRPRGRLGRVPRRRASASATPSWPRARRRCGPATRSTSSSPRARPALPKGATLSHRNILNNGHFIGRRAALHRARPRVRPGARSTTASGWCCGSLACATRGACMVVPGECVRAARPCSGGRRRSAARRSTACRRCSSPSSSEPGFADFDLSSLRTGIMAGAPCPVERHDAGAHAHAHGRGDDRLRHDRDLAASRRRQPSTTRVEKRVETVGRVHPHVEVKIVDPATGATVPRGTPGEQCTRGYSVMLGYWDDEEATRARDRRRRLDAHRRPRGDGRRRLRAASSGGSRT